MTVRLQGMDAVSENAPIGAGTRLINMKKTVVLWFIY